MVNDVHDTADNPQHRLLLVHFSLYLMTHHNLTFYHLLVVHLPLRNNAEGCLWWKVWWPVSSQGSGRNAPSQMAHCRLWGQLLSLLGSSSNPHWTSEGWMNGQPPTSNRGDKNKILCIVLRIHVNLIPGWCEGLAEPRCC